MTYASPDPQPVTPQSYGTTAGAAPVQDAGRGLGIAALILSFFIALLGLILAIVALVLSKKAGAKNRPAVAAVVISILVMIAWVVGGVLLLSGVFGNLFDTCAELGNGVHELNGVTYTCSMGS